MIQQIGCSYTFLLQHDQCSAAQSSLDALNHPWYAVVVAVRVIGTDDDDDDDDDDQLQVVVAPWHPFADRIDMSFSLICSCGEQGNTKSQGMAYVFDGSLKRALVDAKM